MYVKTFLTYFLGIIKKVFCVKISIHIYSENKKIQPGSILSRAEKEVPIKETNAMLKVLPKGQRNKQAEAVLHKLFEACLHRSDKPRLRKYGY